MQEDKQTEQYEEFDYISDFYFPIKDEEQKYADPIISEMRANGIDPYEALGEKKVEGLDPIKRVEEKDIEKEKISYSEAVIDFLKDLPENAILSTAEALANLSNNAVQIGGFISNKMFRDTKLDGISDFTTDVAINYNKGAENYVNSIDQYIKDNDINGVSKFLTDIGIDIAASVPYRKMLKKAGLPNYIATPLSFGLAYGTTGAEKEQELNMFIDSQSINRLNEMLGVIDGTPESEVAELVATTFEGTAWAGITDRLVPIFKSLKKNLPIYMNQQTAVSAGGAAATTEAVNQINESLNQDLNVDQPEQPEQNLEEEKKTLNQSDTLEDADNLYASAGFGPVFFSMVKEAAKKIPNKGSAVQMLNTLKNTKGVKQSELKWTGLDDFLKDKKTVTKQEIQDYLKNNTLEVVEVRYGGQAELPKNLAERKFLFENKLADKRGIIDRDNINYDQYTLYNDTSGENIQIPFDMLDTYFGDDIAKGVIKPNKLFSGPERQKYILDEIQFEKFNLENDIRKFNRGINKAKFGSSDYTSIGGKDYTELVFKLQNNKFDNKYYPVEARMQNSLGVEPQTYIGRTAIDYTSPRAHFGTKNEFAHVRFKTRDLNGKKVLTVEEMQSDLAQGVARGSVKTNAMNEITDFPFKNNWYELTIKRLLRYAADNNFDAVAIPTGSLAAKRYGQSLGKAKNIKHYRQQDDTIVVSFIDDTGEVIQDYGFRETRDAAAAHPFGTLTELENEVGKKLAEQIVASKGTRGNIFLDKPLVIGEGKGKARLYDEAIPSFMKKYGKKWNAKVYNDEFELRPELYQYGETYPKMPVTIIQLTDDMKQSVQQDGQALFSIFGLGLGSKIASDSIENNIISEQTK